MNTVAYASIAFLIVSMLACSSVTYRRRTSSRKTGDVSPVLSIILLLDMIISAVIFFVHIAWMQYVPWYPIVLYLAMANFFISIISLPLPEMPQVNRKYLVQRITGSGWGSVVVSEQDYQDRAIYDAHQLAKENTNAVFVVIDTRGKHIATVNHSGVSVQMHDPNGVF